MDWVVSSLAAINKAGEQPEGATKLGGNLSGTQDLYTVPSSSEPDLTRVVQVVRVPDQPVQFTCSCRAEFGTMQPPAGWVSCWHMGAVARQLNIDEEIHLDPRKGFLLGPGE